MKLQRLDEIICVKPESPETTPLLSKIILDANAARTVQEYLFTPSLRAHFQMVFECAVHRRGQGFWVQAEYGAGKTHFLGTLVNLLIWRDEALWNAVRDDDLRKTYAHPLSKVSSSVLRRPFPISANALPRAWCTRFWNKAATTMHGCCWM